MHRSIMRLFFGLQPESRECLQIASWRDRVLPPLDRPVPAANLHLTLAFLGNVAEGQLESLGAAVDTIETTPVFLTLDELGYWSRPRILWVGTEQVPENLLDLVRQLKRAARTSGLHIESRKYQPHMTLARNCRTPPPPSIEAPHFELAFNRFTLFESVGISNRISRKGKGGVRYDPIAEWTL